MHTISYVMLFCLLFVNIFYLQHNFFGRSIHLHIVYIIYLLIPCSRVLLEQLTGSQLVKNSPASYGTRTFITAFTSVRHLSLSWASSIQSMPHPSSWRSILILHSHLHFDLPSGLFPLGLNENYMYLIVYGTVSTFSIVKFNTLKHNDLYGVAPHR